MTSMSAVDLLGGVEPRYSGEIWLDRYRYIACVTLSLIDAFDLGTFPPVT